MILVCGPKGPYTEELFLDIAARDETAHMHDLRSPLDDTLETAAGVEQLVLVHDGSRDAEHAAFSAWTHDVLTTLITDHADAKKAETSEAALEKRGLLRAGIRNGLHFDALMPLVRVASATGQLPILDHWDFVFAAASTRDYAAAAATIALNAPLEDPRIVLTRPPVLSGSGLASVIKEVTGRPVEVAKMSASELGGWLQASRVAADLAAAVTELYSLLQDDVIGTAGHWWRQPTEGLAQLLGHVQTSWEAVREHLGNQEPKPNS